MKPDQTSAPAKRRPGRPHRARRLHQRRLDPEGGQANIEALGFRVKPGNYLREVWGNYGGTVAARIADLHGMFRDPESESHLGDPRRLRLHLAAEAPGLR
jgi:hypothetical protein